VDDLRHFVPPSQGEREGYHCHSERINAPASRPPMAGAAPSSMACRLMVSATRRLSDPCFAIRTRARDLPGTALAPIANVRRGALLPSRASMRTPWRRATWKREWSSSMPQLGAPCIGRVHVPRTRGFC
jgi:hypothetical protein